VLNESRVLERLFDSQDSASSASTVYFPWLMSPNCADVGYNASRLPWFDENNTISGTLFNDLTLPVANYTIPISGAIESGVTLTILPGTCFYFYNGASLEVRGTVIANASGATPICFDAHSSVPGNAYWGRMLFKSGSGYDVNGNYVNGSYFNNVIIRRGGTCGSSSCSVVRIDGPTHPAMENVRIFNNRWSAIEITSRGAGLYKNLNISNNPDGYGIYFPSDNYYGLVRIDSSFFSNNYQHIFGYKHFNLVVSGNTFYPNVYQSWAINIDQYCGCDPSQTTYMRFLNNTFVG